MNIRNSFEPPLLDDSIVITGSELNNRLFRLSDDLRDAQDELRSAALDMAKAEHKYRSAKAIAYLTVKAAPDNVKATVATLEAMVDKSCADERESAYISRAMDKAATERVKSLRAQLSALQSVAAAVRSEHELSRY